MNENRIRQNLRKVPQLWEIASRSHKVDLVKFRAPRGRSVIQKSILSSGPTCPSLCNVLYFFYVSQKHHKMRFWNVKNKCTKQFWERTPSNGGRVSRMGFRHFRQIRLRSSNRLQYWDLSWDLVQNQWETWFWERKVVWEHFLQSETLRKTFWRHGRACGRRKPR